MLFLTTVSLEINSLRKGRCDMLRRPINGLALGGRGCLSVPFRCLHENASVTPQGMITNGQSLNHSWAATHAMRIVTALTLLLTAWFSPVAHGTASEVLLASEYDPAEAVFRLFLDYPPLPKQGWRTNLIYCLSFGRSNSPLPVDFITRFAATPLRVITDTNALVFSPGGAMAERASARPAVVLALRVLEIKGDRAEASIRWIDSSRTVSQVYHFVKEERGWKYQNGFSTLLPRDGQHDFRTRL